MMRVAVFMLSVASVLAQTDFPVTTCNDGSTGWNTDDETKFIARMIWGAVVGILLGLVMVILTSLPLCCGIAKGMAKPFAIASIVLGFLAILMPYFGSLATSCDDFISGLCKHCTYTGGDCTQSVCDGCDSDFKTTMTNNCSIIGFFVAYAAWGWLAVILGVTAIAMGGCIFCGCCKMKDDGAGAYVEHNGQGQYNPPTTYA